MSDRPAHLSTTDLVTYSTATQRQVERWAAAGVYGPEHVDVGSGARRRYTDEDLAVTRLLSHVAAIGGAVAGGSGAEAGALRLDTARAVSVAYREVAQAVDDDMRLVVFPDGTAYAGWSWRNEPAVLLVSITAATA